jgi:hypothetical protein
LPEVLRPLLGRNRERTDIAQANLTVTGHEFIIRSDHLIAVQVLLDPGIPKTSV